MELELSSLSSLHIAMFLFLFVFSTTIRGQQNKPTDFSPGWLRWGPYRPGLYFGVRPAVPNSLLFGLMWASGETPDEMIKTIRDTCEQNDGMDGYGWTAYNTRFGGSQTIYDTKLGIDLTTDFLKAETGDSWAVEVSGRPKLGARQNVKTTIIFHAAVEKDVGDESAPDDKSLICDGLDSALKAPDTTIQATCHGNMPLLGGNFEIQVAANASNKQLHDARVVSMKVDDKEVWKAKDFLKALLMKTAYKSVSIKNDPGPGNLHFIQMTFEGPFTATLSYREGNASTLDVQGGIDNIKTSLPISIDKAFPRMAPFDKDTRYRDFSQAMLSNLLGGMGFSHGQAEVDLTHNPKYDETELNFWEAGTSAQPATFVSPRSLLTYTPSRPFFPRGFLWDEGFHLLPIVEWDFDLAVAVLQSWLALMDDDGWIAREQILGPEARSRVPPEFRKQLPHHANPPTLLLLLPILVSKLTGASAYHGHPSIFLSSKDKGLELIKSLYPYAARYYNWFRRTQAGNFTAGYPRPKNAIFGEGYRWKGRAPGKCLTSGLDDYPRAEPPHPAELHLDALAWVGAAANALNQVAHFLGDKADEKMYSEQLSDIKHNLDAVHWSPANKTYCDLTVDAEMKNNVHVCREGYLSLFPLLLGLLDSTHPNLPAVLDLIGDESKLWSPYGLRSLSASDPAYHTHEDYWRGAAWMNLNVLAVLRLRALGVLMEDENGKIGSQRTAVQTKALELAALLRQRLVKTVFESWEKTGFFWEQYSDFDGQGLRSRAFTGWTACVILLMGLGFDGVAVGEYGKSTGEAGSPSQTGTGDFPPKTWGTWGTWGTVLALASLMLLLLCRKRVTALFSQVVGRLAPYKGRFIGRWSYERVRNVNQDEVPLEERIQDRN